MLSLHTHLAFWPAGILLLAALLDIQKEQMNKQLGTCSATMCCCRQPVMPAQLR